MSCRNISEVKEITKILSEHLVNSDICPWHEFLERWQRLNQPERCRTCDWKANILLANRIERVQSIPRRSERITSRKMRFCTD